MMDTIKRLESEVRGYVRQFPTVFTKAVGAMLKDRSGKQYIDFFAGAGALNYGHNNPRSKHALLEYLVSDGVHHSLDMATTAKLDFLRAFEDLILKPRQLDYRIQFTGPTGTNAVEAAIKLARKCKRRNHIVAFTNAYHGHTLGALALTGNRQYHSEYLGSRQNVTHVPYDGYAPGVDSAALFKRMLDDPSSGLPLPAAVILETIQSEGGVRVASMEWLRNIAEICRQRDILLIVDDIQVGCGRTGTFFSFEQAGIKPDLVCLSKSIGGGLPMSLVLINPVCDQWQPGEHTGTFRGNNLAFVASTSLLEYWRDEQLARQIAEYADIIQVRLESIVSQYAWKQFQVRGRGMIWGLDVGCGALAQQITTTAFKNGLIIETAGADGSVIKLLPPLTIEPRQLDVGLRILGEAVEQHCGENPESRAANAVIPPFNNVMPGLGDFAAP